MANGTALRGNTTARKLAALSKWVDAANAHRDPEAILWGRVAKVSEECGEAIAALIGATGQNPRKGVVGHTGVVVKELLDVAVTALAAVEHIGGNHGTSMDMLADHVDYLILCAEIELRRD